jgi:hypothetical protein
VCDPGGHVDLVVVVFVVAVWVRDDLEQELGLLHRHPVLLGCELGLELDCMHTRTSGGRG